MLRPSPIRARKSLGSNKAAPRSRKTALFFLLAFAFKGETDAKPGLSTVNFATASPAFGGNQENGTVIPCLAPDRVDRKTTTLSNDRRLFRSPTSSGIRPR